MKREAAEIKLAKLKEEYNAISAERVNVQQKIDQNRRIAEDMEAKVSLDRSRFCLLFIFQRADHFLAFMVADSRYSKNNGGRNARYPRGLRRLT